MAQNPLNNPERALDITTKIATNASKISKQALSALLELITFSNTGNGFYLGNPV